MSSTVSSTVSGTVSGVMGCVVDNLVSDLATAGRRAATTNVPLHPASSCVMNACRNAATGAAAPPLREWRHPSHAFPLSCAAATMATRPHDEHDTARIVAALLPCRCHDDHATALPAHALRMTMISAPTLRPALAVTNPVSPARARRAAPESTSAPVARQRSRGGHIPLIAIASLALLLAAACRPPAASHATLGDEGAEAAIPTAGVETTPEAPPANPPVRNVILLIGDGMGPQQMGLLELYARWNAEGLYPDGRTAMARMMDAGHVGLSSVDPTDGLVNDSAGSGTQLAAGVATRFGFVGLGEDEQPVETLVQLAHRLGKRSGLVSDTRLTHATPASFAATGTDRWAEATLAEQMIATGAHVMLSGGLRVFVPRAVNSEGSARQALLEAVGGAFEPRSNRRDDVDLLAQAREAGYTVVHDREALRAVSGERVLGLFANNAMESGLEWWAARDDANHRQPSLRELTRHALRLLEDHEEGFFLMVEGGQIDWAGHNNEASRLLREMIRFDEAVDEVLRWVEGRDDTLVVLTADHETGGFSLHYERGTPPPPEVLADLDGATRFVRWSTTNHTHTPVVVVGLGPEHVARAFGGMRSHPEVGRLMMTALEHGELPAGGAPTQPVMANDEGYDD